MAGFAGVDFIDFDSQLNDEEKLVRQTARRFVDNEIIPIIEKHSREGTFPKHLVPQLGELGFFGASLQGYGCVGMSNVAKSDFNSSRSGGAMRAAASATMLIDHSVAVPVSAPSIYTHSFLN